MRPAIPLLLLAAACGALEPPSDDYAFFRIGGLMGTTYEVRLDGRAVLYTVQPGLDETRVAWKTAILGEEEHAAFLAELEAIGVFDWERTYADPDVADGTQWSVVIVAGGRRASSSGSNAYPPGFDAFKRAVADLVGERFE